MTGFEVDIEGATYIPILSKPAMQPWIATTLFGPIILFVTNLLFSRRRLMGESGDDLICPNVFQVVHGSLAPRGELALSHGATHLYKRFQMSACLKPST